MPKIAGEIVITVLTIALEIVLWLASEDIPPASRAYPRALIMLAFGLSLAFLCICLYKMRKEGLLPLETKVVPGASVQIAVLCVLICAYFVLMEHIGYLIMTPLFILACMLYLGMRNKLALFLTPAILTGFTYYLFNDVLFVFLPRGILY